jgi:oligopeptide/dipeptide ABC transporter ATP-binding protein
MSEELLHVQDLKVAFGQTEILRGVSFFLRAGETLGIVGESGCGKSMTAFALMGMLPAPGKVVGGSIRFEGTELVGLLERRYRKLRGEQIALVMQDPFTSLNPLMRVGEQIAETLRVHRGLSHKAAKARAIELLQEVGVPNPPASARKYPHEMSGGQRQRVVIAIAFACNPKLLIADEPTTALDVTLQAQIMLLLKRLQEQHHTAVIVISHDIGVIGALSDRVCVFYAGRIVESGSAQAVLRGPAHPYTQGLLGAMPSKSREPLSSIPGQPPSFASMPDGCAFRPRCRLAMETCEQMPPDFELEDRLCACWLHAPVSAIER